MRLAIATVQVPFTTGGAELLARGLRDALRTRGHEAEIVTLPFKWYPSGTLLDAMRMAQLVDLTEVNGQPIDRVVALKFPAYLLRHPDKVIWLLHQHRQAYDLWGTPFGDLHAWPDGEEVRRAIVDADSRALGEARALFTLSRNVAERLHRFNGLTGAPLYPPPPANRHWRCDRFEGFILCPGRLDPIKRQDLVLRALGLMRSDLTLVFVGGGTAPERRRLAALARDLGLERRIGWAGPVSDEELVDLYARCRAAWFGGYDEDYGYVPIEAFLSGKPAVVHTDAGGPLEFVVEGHNGRVVPPDPAALAAALDTLADASLAAQLGAQGNADIRGLDITWDRVVGRLLSDLPD